MHKRHEHREHHFLPHRHELKDEHVVMACGYGTGSLFAHSVIGMLIVAGFYLFSAAVIIAHNRSQL